MDPITSFLMMNTYRDETMRMMGKQLLGMLVGMAVFVAVTHFIPDLFGYSAFSLWAMALS